MSQLDLANAWQPDPARRSPIARLLGIARLSAKQLRHRFLESLLILLGISLGVGVLTSMETLLRFLVNVENEAVFSQAELRAVSVRPKTFDMTELYGVDSVAAVRVTGEFADPVQLTTDDLLAARREVLGIDTATLPRRSWGAQIIAVDGLPAQIDDQPGPALEQEQVTPDEFRFRGLELLAGRAPTWEEFEAGSHVLVLDEPSAQSLFPSVPLGEVIGRTITTSHFGPAVASQGAEWRIIGIVGKEPEPQWLVAGMEPERSSVRSYALRTTGEPLPIPVNQLTFAPADDGELETLVTELEIFFSHRLGPDRVTVTNPLENLLELAQTQRTVSITLMGLAGLALFVASINILNLFTARVIRRRRITAMSVALGAERRSLFGAVLTEAVLLGVGGSLVGLLVASGIVMFVRTLLMGQFAAVAMDANPFAGLGLTLPDALIGLLAGAGTSLLFGLYPAYVSASIDPSEGLRRE